MTFEQQFVLFVLGIVTVGALTIYGVHRATRMSRFGRVRADLAERGHTATIPTRPRHGARPHDRAVVRGTGGAGRPSVGTPDRPQPARPRHASAA
jgi:hypothetical protein